MIRARLAVAFIVISSAAPSRAGADVQFAQPSDPVTRALFPSIDTTTGMTPVAEPEIAVGRAPARSARAGCAPGFRIAELSVSGWETGADSVYLAVFLVTTDSPSGVAAPCYHPEPWACVVKKSGDRWMPMDCARVEQGLFPGEIGGYGSVYRLNGQEKAFTVRVANETGHRYGQTKDEVLVLFRFHDGELSQVLVAPSRREETDDATGTQCRRLLLLRDEPTQTIGFFDKSLELGVRTGSGACAIDPEPAGFYRWNGRRYIAQ